MPIDIASHTPSICVCRETLSLHLDILVEEEEDSLINQTEDFPAGDAAECEMREGQRREKPFRVLFRRRSVCVCVTHTAAFSARYPLLSSVGRPSRVYHVRESRNPRRETHTHTLREYISDGLNILSREHTAAQWPL